MKTRPISKTEILLIGLILVTGFFLRFYHFFHIPYTHDEFSALFRTEFPSLKDLLQFGVKPDGHPVGIQVFLYFWSRWFGEREFIIKLPFLLAGVASIWLSYRLTNRIFGKGSGLPVAALIATLEYFVMYSQLARPYAAGLLFSLLMVNSWVKLILSTNRKRFSHLAGFIVFGALCMYTHYFSFLLVILVSFSGLFFLKGKVLKEYLFAGLILLILFLPHFTLTLFDLDSGGLAGWLGKPDIHFITDYFGYAFQYSVFNYFFVGSVLISGIYYSLKREKLKTKSGSVNKDFNPESGSPLKNKLALHFLLWFLFSLIIGFFYSKWRQPVLQFSSLLFVFPFLLMAIFSCLKIHRPVLQIIIILLILIANVYTLISKRKYYDLFYHSAYEELIGKNIQVATKYPKNNFVFISDIPAKIRLFYLKKYRIKAPLNYVNTDRFRNNKDFELWLDTLNVKTIYYGTIHTDSPEIYSIIENHFPTLIESTNYFLGNYYAFSQKGERKINAVRFKSLNDFELPVSSWSTDTSRIFQDPNSHVFNPVFQLDSLTKFGPTFSLKTDTFHLVQGNQIDVKIDVLSTEKMNNALLVVSLESDQKVLWWNASPGFAEYQTAGKWTSVFFSERFPKNLLKRNKLILKVYIWNKEHEKFYIDRFMVRILNGNPVLYGLYERI